MIDRIRYKPSCLFLRQVFESSLSKTSTSEPPAEQEYPPCDISNTYRQIRHLDWTWKTQDWPRPSRYCAEVSWTPGVPFGKKELDPRSTVRNQSRPFIASISECNRSKKSRGKTGRPAEAWSLSCTRTDSKKLHHAYGWWCRVEWASNAVASHVTITGPDKWFGST